MKIKHISFDVWNTLVKPNPQYAKERRQAIAALFHLDEAFVAKIYAYTKKHVDLLAEVNGEAYSTDTVYELLLNNLGVEKDTKQVRSIVEGLFDKYPPIIEDEVREQIQFLSSKYNLVTLSIGSNSNFISGNVMLPFLEKSFGIKFKFGLFSDLTLTGKPSKLFFNEIEKQAGVSACNILHVGDHLICDGFGASRSGMIPMIIKDHIDITSIPIYLVD